MKILLIGKTGQLGSTLLKQSIIQGHNVFAPSRKDLNIVNEESFLNVVNKYKPSVIINTAAFTDVLKCESANLKAIEVNATAVEKMARICAKNDIWFITFSTDYVFDGKKGEPYDELDRTFPIQWYGVSKTIGECNSLNYGKTIVIRTCGLYGSYNKKSNNKNFVDERVKDILLGKEFSIRSDLTISPTCTYDLSIAVLELINSSFKRSGIYHLVNEGHCTWYELTKEIANILDVDVIINPVDRKGKTGSMKRPLFTALKNNEARNIGIELPHWKDALKRYLETKYPNRV